MKKILQLPWAGALLGCLLYLATTAAMISPHEFESARAQAKAVLSPGNEPSWKFRNPEFEQWVEELRTEREALARRQKELNELQARLEAERTEISTITQTVFNLQKEFDRSIVRWKEQEGENLKHQAKVIAGMSPEGAAALFSQMAEEEMVRTLYSLKPDSASGILDALSKLGPKEARKAADATEKLRLVLPPSKDSPRSSSGS